MKTNNIPKAKCIGNAKDGFVLSLHSSTDGFKWDVSLTKTEMEVIVNAILKKLK